MKNKRKQISICFEVINMTAKDIQVRIQKNKDKIEKKEKLIAKLSNKVESMENKLSKNGWSMEDFAKYEYAEYCSYYDLLERIESNQKQISEIYETITKQEVQLSKYLKKEKEVSEIPQAFMDLEPIVAEWTYNTLIAEQERLQREKHTYSTLKYASLSELEKMAKKEAHSFVLDLYAKVVSITGKDIYQLENIHFGNDGLLNGVVYGKQGVAEVHTIMAGGYNIQRLHTRCLVNRIG